MKFSFMTFSTPNLSLDDVLELAKKLGYDGIEPRIDCKHAHGIELAADAASRKAARNKAAKAGVAYACVATSCKYADPATNAAMRETTLRAIDLAGDIGAPRIRVFGGGLPKDFPREKAIDLLAESLRAVADRAATRKVSVCMETHDDWCDPSHVAAVMKKVSHPAIAVNWDIMHPVRACGWTVEDSYRTLKQWIRHLHVHDGKWVGGEADDKTGGTGRRMDLAPIGTGVVDHRKAIELLKADKFRGFLSGEWISWESYETHLPRELATLKKYDAE
jgi:sugar phosphate isomerase/epimerase